MCAPYLHLLVATTLLDTLTMPQLWPTSPIAGALSSSVAPSKILYSSSFTLLHIKPIYSHNFKYYLQMRVTADWITLKLHVCITNCLLHLVRIHIQPLQFSIIKLALYSWLSLSFSGTFCLLVTEKENLSHFWLPSFPYFPTWLWWYIPVISATQKAEQEDKFEASLGDLTRPCLKRK